MKGVRIMKSKQSKTQHHSTRRLGVFNCYRDVDKEKFLMKILEIPGPE